MILHPQLQLEEQFKPAYWGKLHHTESRVSNDYPAATIDWFYNGAQIDTSETYETSEHVDTLASVSVEDILNLHLGASSDAKSTDNVRIGDKYGPFTIPAGHIGVLRLCVQGSVHFYNCSQYGGQGYLGDSRIDDVRGVNFGVAFTEHSGSSIGDAP